MISAPTRLAPSGTSFPGRPPPPGRGPRLPSQWAHRTWSSGEVPHSALQGRGHMPFCPAGAGRPCLHGSPSSRPTSPSTLAVCSTGCQPSREYRSAHPATLQGLPCPPSFLTVLLRYNSPCAEATRSQHTVPRVSGKVYGGAEFSLPAPLSLLPVPLRPSSSPKTPRT